MADARSLLRAHRAANRIEHPYAAYSDSGKLLCKLCREVIKSESLWESHTRSADHRQKAAAANSATDRTAEAAHSKRKHDDVEAMDAEEDSEDGAPRKRNRTTSSAAANNSNGAAGAHTPERNGASGNSPGLARRASMTPAHGIELSIPSRPATPQIAGEGSLTPTHSVPPMGPTPTSAPAAGSAFQIPPISTESLPAPTSAPAPVDEAEWAAFEAEMAAADDPPPAAPGFAMDATISAPAQTAADIAAAAAKSLDEENERRKQLLEAQTADEREDAARALEDEFDEMAQLESRVRRLKERREMLRRAGGGGGSDAAAAGVRKAQPPAGKENAAVRNGEDAESDDEDDEEDDDEDWDDGFRFRA